MSHADYGAKHAERGPRLPPVTIHTIAKSAKISHNLERVPKQLTQTLCSLPPNYDINECH